ncbi:ankyrin repeat-containing protein BDA1-like [Cornus florida]|uniref:ankyrin repeat-containing protein BDA1-like n=1 Tax=Cornus florida TaxID=4283 RepID=UPI0028A1C994|nr:ankyrin repeat-containing protein BDA1-like [Cornus florida]
MEQRLKNAAEEGNIDALYALFQENKYILQDIDQIPFVHTPLHIAASAGCTHFAVEMISLKPSFASVKVLTVRGETVVYIATRNGSFQAFKVILGWLHKFYIQELLNWKDKDGNTEMHIAVSANQLLVLSLAPFCLRAAVYLQFLLMVVELLINNKADKVATNWEGKTALDSSEPNEEVRNILVRAGASKASFPPKLTKVWHIL